MPMHRSGQRVKDRTAIAAIVATLCIIELARGGDVTATEAASPLLLGVCGEDDNCTQSRVHVVTLDAAAAADAADAAAGPNGYSGETDVMGRPHGIGVLQTDDLVYTGQFEHGMFNGRGTVVWTDNGTYIGDFRSGMPHGRGRHIAADASVFWGGWVDGRRHGLGILSRPDSFITTFGEWDSNEMLGRGVSVENVALLESEGTGSAVGRRTKRGSGICTFENGDTYVGQWLANESPGRGSGGNTPPAPPPPDEENRGACVWESWAPQWPGGSSVSFHGSGFFKYGNGDYYAGELKNMARDGKGTYVGVDGGKYAGSWKGGRYHGVGALFLPGGKGVQAGQWDNNQFLGEGNLETLPPNV